MLHEVSITDFAIIEKTSFSLSDSLNVLTGETGAGKSILLDALGAVLGSRVSSDLVRTGARVARVEAVFSLTPAAYGVLGPELVELGIDLATDGDLILSREIQASGRSIARINGRLTTATVQSRIGAALVDIHGQSDHLAILHASEQLRLLDRFAGTVELRSEVAAQTRSLRALRTRRRDLEGGSREREQLLDLLRFQIDEIGAGTLVAGEDVTLGEERTVLQGADSLRMEVGEALASLTETDEIPDASNALQLLRHVERSVQNITAIDAGTGELGEHATELVVLAEELGRDIRSYGEGIESRPERLGEIDDRLSLIQALKRKYGSSIEDVVAFGLKAQAQLEELTGESFDAEALHDREEAITRELSQTCLSLSRQRQLASGELSARVEASIAELRMGRSQVAIHISQREDPDGIPIVVDGSSRTVAFDETGVDSVAFMIAPNAGEALKPLGQIASGGETARLMLAIKSILSDVDTIPTLVFDEIDVGVGGRSGQVVGNKLRSLAREHQVIVVTHLPQIAARAERHFAITKVDRDSRTISEVRELDKDERLRELAAMIDGLPVTEHAIASATEMLDRSRVDDGQRSDHRPAGTSRPTAR